MVVEGNPVAPKVDVASCSTVLLEGTLVKLGGLHWQRLLSRGQRRA